MITWGETTYPPDKADGGHSPVRYGHSDNSRGYGSARVRTYVRCQCGKRLSGQGESGGLASWRRHRARPAVASWYVKRERGTRVGWVGPIRSEAQADREVAAWTNPDPHRWGEAGPWTAAKYPTSPQVRAEVRAWERQAKGYPGEVTR